ncbi:60S ribosomal protein L12 [Zea mays]|uniref:60S ribosomal protein L12 n=2 Tax=Zea mays TaxID=4577 RepID=A0A3L6D5W6_MAIZE|nr:60S ribosomal protein L12 [Zea mays]PWZ30425.1 60S ribosomal protein L12 [Zea mays]
MPPKLDPSQVVEVFVRVTGGEAKVSVIPSAAALVIKALKELERDRKKVKNIKHSGNISLDDVIEIAKTMQHRSMAKELAGTVKEILGTCVSVGCTVDGKDPKDLQQEIDDGESSNQILIQVLYYDSEYPKKGRMQGVVRRRAVFTGGTLRLKRSGQVQRSERSHAEGCLPVRGEDAGRQETRKQNKDQKLTNDLHKINKILARKKGEKDGVEDGGHYDDDLPSSKKQRG